MERVLWWWPGEVELPAISVRAPWWWWVVHGPADMVGRYWTTEYRGPVMIHASKWWGVKDVRAENSYARELAGLSSGEGDAELLGDGSALDDLRERGGMVVGMADLAAVVENANVLWNHEGRYQLHLVNRRPIREPFAMRGERGLFSRTVRRRLLR